MSTDAQVNVGGPLQPAGSVARSPDTPKPVIRRPSLEVNAMLIVRLAPAATDTVAAAEGVPTAEFSEPVTVPLLEIGSLGAFEPVLPSLPFELSFVPRLLL
jgi:hypothetical protein